MFICVLHVMINENMGVLDQKMASPSIATFAQKLEVNGCRCITDDHLILVNGSDRVRLF